MVTKLWGEKSQSDEVQLALYDKLCKPGKMTTAR